MLDVKATVDALVNNPIQQGWRGNTSHWAKRAHVVLSQYAQCLSEIDRQRIAACIRDVRLLRPDLAIYCPAHIRNTWDALYADVCHVVVTQKPATMSTINWIGALAYYVRHHPNMGVKRARQIVAPSVSCLSTALSDDVWKPNKMEESRCPKRDGLCTRTILILLSATLMRFGLTDVIDAAVHWLCQRPVSHFCDRLIDLVPNTIISNSLECKRQKSKTCHTKENTTSTSSHPCNLFASTSLCFFDDKECSH
jgi:hypothetical protein